MSTVPGICLGNLYVHLLNVFKIQYISNMIFIMSDVHTFFYGVCGRRTLTKEHVT